MFKLRQVYLATLVLLAVPALGQSDGQPGDEWAGSETCIECHEDRHESWHRTYHRTMTQTANTATVRGRFDGQPVTYWGVTVRPVRRNNQFWFDYYFPGESSPFTSLQIVRTVGSHRYQQYLTQVEGAADNYYRLHLLWHIQDRRWVHMNGAFLGSDDQGFDDNVALWNHNCIFCHNTGPEPHIQNYDELLRMTAQGQPVDLDKQSLYESKVSELGISCETCHGPSAEHVRVNRNPLKRMWNNFRDRDSTVINPDRLDQERSVQVCGQCHGQRTPVNYEIIDQWLTTGPVYRAGDDLMESVKLVWQDTHIIGDNDPDRFRLRFWPDGTPRLSAYEFQGLLQSECYTESDTLTCQNCHSMHGGDPDGMTTEWQRGNGPCLECHQEYEDEPSTHTMHAADSSGSECSSCHMPRMVYGVMTIHRSHRIEIPDPAQNTRDQRPNACNLCHLDQSSEWAAMQTEYLWRNGPEPGDVTEDQPAAGVHDLYAGDPVQRAVAAWSLEQALGREEQPAQQWVPHLLTVMRDDKYPAVRRFAGKAAAAAFSQQQQTALLDELQLFDFIGSADSREQVLQALITRWEQRQSDIRPADAQMLLDADGRIDPRVSALQAEGRAKSVGINIGE